MKHLKIFPSSWEMKFWYLKTTILGIVSNIKKTLRREVMKIARF